MSTLRINNIEAQSVPASPTIDEKVKVTNSSGDILVNIDGKTSGITTIGINTTDGNIKFDANSNVLITGILTATTLAGNFTPDSLEIGSNIKLGNAGVITATSLDISGDIDVDGHTELDNINISGVSTHVGLSQFQNTINLTHASAGQNYIYFTEDLQFAKNGTGTRLKIHSNGNVSIGNNPTVASDTLLHVEKSGETNVIFEGDTTTLGARLTLKNNNTAAGAKNQIDFSDAGGQSTSTIIGYNTDQTNNYGELAFHTRSAQGSPPAERLRIDSSGNVTISTGNLTIPDSIIHSGDTDTKIAFTNNQIDLQCAGASRAYINNYALYIASGFPLAFLASSGATPNIKSGGTNAQDLLFTTGSGNPTRMQITSAGSVLSASSFVSKATADVNVTISTASGFTANTFVTVINHGVLEEESVYIISFKWNHGSSGQQPYFSHGAFVFNPSEVNTGSTGGQGPNYAPFQGHHMHTGVNRYWSFRYYGATGGTSVHGLQAAFDQTLNQSSGTLQIRATKIAKVTTI